MQQVTIAGQAYEVVGLSDQDQETYRDYCVLLARRADRPFERFIRKECQNLTREERQDALIAWRQAPGWDDPPEELVSQWGRHPKAVAALAKRVLRPEAEAVHTQLCSALRAIIAPSDDEIGRHNQIPPPPPPRPPTPTR